MLIYWFYPTIVIDYFIGTHIIDQWHPIRDENGVPIGSIFLKDTSNRFLNDFNNRVKAAVLIMALLKTV